MEIRFQGHERPKQTKLFSYAGILFGALILSGCGNASDPPENPSTQTPSTQAQETASIIQLEQGDVLLLVQSEDNGGMASQLQGSIAESGEGCIGVATPEGEFVPVIFPFGTAFDSSAEGNWLAAAASGLKFGVGDRVTLGGGFVSEPEQVRGRCAMGPEGTFSAWEISGS